MTRHRIYSKSFQTSFLSFRVQFRYAFWLQKQTHAKQYNLLRLQLDIWYILFGKFVYFASYCGVGSPLNGKTKPVYQHNPDESEFSLINIIISAKIHLVLCSDFK